MLEIDYQKQLLIVDDEARVLNSICRLLRKDDIICHIAKTGAEGIDIFKKNDIGVVLSDQQMPHMDGVTFLKKIRDLNPDTVRMLLTGYSNKANAIEAINKSGVFMYLTKPWDNDELRASIERAFSHYHLKMENKQLLELTQFQNESLRTLNLKLEDLVAERTSELHTAVRTGILMLSNAAEAKDEVTGGHVLRIADLTERICLAMGMNPTEAEEIGFFSIMHDVGKIHIPDHILQKRGKLTDDEFRIMKRHSAAGEKIIGNSKFYTIAKQIARHHHEKWDGTGYPDGYSGEQIPLPARVVAVVDVFDALTHERPYKEAWPQKRALEEIASLSGKAFDPTVVEAFLKVVYSSPNAVEKWVKT
jgi:response regulator RpfG family c-di-GMP phosphodiesterase